MQEGGKDIAKETLDEGGSKGKSKDLSVWYNGRNVNN